MLSCDKVIIHVIDNRKLTSDLNMYFIFYFWLGCLFFFCGQPSFLLFLPKNGCLVNLLVVYEMIRQPLASSTAFVVKMQGSVKNIKCKKMYQVN